MQNQWVTDHWGTVVAILAIGIGLILTDQANAATLTNAQVNVGVQEDDSGVHQNGCTWEYVSDPPASAPGEFSPVPIADGGREILFEFDGSRTVYRAAGGCNPGYSGVIRFDIYFDVAAQPGEVWTASVDSSVDVHLSHVAGSGGNGFSRFRQGPFVFFRCLTTLQGCEGMDNVEWTSLFDSSAFLPSKHDISTISHTGSKQVGLRFHYVVEGNAGTPGGRSEVDAGHRIVIRLRSPSEQACADAIESLVFDLECMDDDKGCIRAVLTTATTTVGEAAQICGYDHFNWLNIVLRDQRMSECLAAAGDPSVHHGCNPLRTQDGSLPRPPYADPPPGGYRYMACEASADPVACSFDLSDPGARFPAADSSEPYYDECTGAPYTEGCWYPWSQKLVASNKFEFFDRPGTAPGYTTEFATILAGVHANGSWEEVQIPGLRTLLRWRYIGTTDDIVEIRSEPPPGAEAGYGTFEFVESSERIGEACDDDVDNDGDGFTDFSGGDPGCQDTSSTIEDPECQDGLNNDGMIGTDFDGGDSVLGNGAGDPDGADPQCEHPWQDMEALPEPDGIMGLLSGLAALGLLARRRSICRLRPEERRGAAVRA